MKISDYNEWSVTPEETNLGGSKTTTHYEIHWRNPKAPNPTRKDHECSIDDEVVARKELSRLLKARKHQGLPEIEARIQRVTVTKETI